MGGQETGEWPGPLRARLSVASHVTLVETREQTEPDPRAPRAFKGFREVALALPPDAARASPV